MRAVAEYRIHAEECRKLAKLMAVPADRNAFEEMAQTWEILAKLREGDIEPKDWIVLSYSATPAKLWG
jgi:hypothetical protein